MRILGIISLLLLAACNSQETQDNEVLVKLEGDKLLADEVLGAIPKDVSREDSSRLSNQYIESWVKHHLLLQKAELNVGNDDKVQELISNYKEQLLIETYLQLLVEKKAEISPTEDQIETFYENNKAQYLLPENLLKGTFVVLPLDASNKKTLRQLLEAKEIDQAMIEAYCLQNAAKVDFFNDKWVAFRNIARHLPELKDTEKRILSRNTFYETEDSIFNYIIKIEEYKLKGDIAPLSYVHKEIEEYLLNNNKISYLQRMEKDLYDDAIRKGIVQDNRQ